MPRDRTGDHVTRYRDTEFIRAILQQAPTQSPKFPNPHEGRTHVSQRQDTRFSAGDVCPNLALQCVDNNLPQPVNYASTWTQRVLTPTAPRSAGDANQF